MTDTNQAPPRRLTRSATDRMVGGVCGGLADYTGLDPVIFRVVVAVATIMGGAGLAAYLLAWLIIPGPEGDSTAETLLRRRDFPRLALLGLGLFVVAVLASIRPGNWPQHGGGNGFGLLLTIAIGLWLWRRHESHPPMPAPVPVATPATVATPPTPPPAPSPPPPRSKLGLLTVSSVLVVAGILALAEVSVATALAGCLIVVGGGLLVGGWIGNARWLIVIGVFLAGATAVASVADVPLAGGAGDRRWHAPTDEALRSRYRLGVGNAELDLTDLVLSRDRHVTVTVGAGDLRVYAPADVDLVVDAHAGFGVVSILGREDDGADVDRHVHDDEGDVRLELELKVGVGRVEVDR
jgi:phage shock protein PspC (stress-responsive transcriptional regulator)